MKRFAVLVLLLFVQPASGQQQDRRLDFPRQIYGKVQVLSGTTFRFQTGDTVVRLAGYEASRIEQLATSNGVEWPAGQVARAWMVLRTLGQDLNCTPIVRDRSATVIAHCFVGDTNLAATAIAEGVGYAFNYPGEPSVPAYFDIERKARGLGYGVWSSNDLLPPWLYHVPAATSQNRDDTTTPYASGLPLPSPVGASGSVSLDNKQGG